MPLQRNHRHTPHNLRALLFDLGDTLMWEESEVKAQDGTTTSAELLPGAERMIRNLRERGFAIGLVADSAPRTPVNVLEQHGLLDCFDTIAISELVGVMKPDPRIFAAALAGLGVEPKDYPRVVMVGNHLERDIAGANALGLISVLMHASNRRSATPSSAVQTPDHVVESIAELESLIDRLDAAPIISKAGGAT